MSFNYEERKLILKLKEKKAKNKEKINIISIEKNIL